MLLEGQQLGRYDLLRLLGRGKSETYLTRDTRTARQVALKVFRTETLSQSGKMTSEEITKRFMLAMDPVSRLNHTHIAPLYDYGTENIDEEEYMYLVTPFCQEGSFARWLQERTNAHIRPLPLQDVVQIVCQVAEALQYAHDRQIVHQDIKFSNLLLISGTENKECPDLLLADFGITSFMAAMSGENQAPADNPLDQKGDRLPAADQYALALLAYQLLTNASPFPGNEQNAEAANPPAQTPQPLPPSTYNPLLSSAIDGVLLHALAQLPEKRFATVSEFADAFRDASRIGSDLRATLTISKEEAESGTERIVHLPEGRQVTVSVPAGSVEGQVFCLEGQGELPDGGIRGDLIITIKVKAAVKAAVEVASLASLPPADHPEAAIATSAPFYKSSLKTSSLQPALHFVHTVPLVKKISLLVLVFLVIMGSGSILYSVMVHQAISSGVDATATAQIRAVSTIYAATATPRASATAFAALDPYPPKDGTLMMDDPLTNNKRGNEWDDMAGCDFTGGSYQVSSAAGVNYCTASPSFHNFTYEAQVTLTQGDFAGIVFRLNSSKNTYYYLGINASGGYALIYSYNDSPYIYDTNSTLIPILSGTSPTIKAGLNQPDLLAVVANGRHLDLYVNMQHVASVRDALDSSGQIGVAAGYTVSEADAQFSNVRVWDI